MTSTIEKVGSEFLVNTETEGWQVMPTVMDLPGGLGASWTDTGGGMDRGALTYDLVPGAHDANRAAVVDLTFSPDGSYSFQGSQGFASTVSFTSAASDGTATPNTATVTLAVAGLPTQLIHGTAKSESLRGGDGLHDTIHAGGGDDLVFGRSGRDRLFGDGGDDRLEGGYGHDRLSGGDGADRLSGGRGDDLLFGDGGDDRLDGGYGHDRLSGGDGADRLSGGRGDDLLAGNGGADVFVFGPETGRITDTGADRIADFQLGLDHIRLGEGVAVVSVSTSHLNDNDRLDTTLILSNGGTVEVMDVGGLATDDWALIG